MLLAVEPRTPHRAHRPSSFEATGPGQVWTWDITYLRNAKATGEFFYAYVIADIFTRKIVHQAVYDADNETYAKEFLGKAFRQRGIKPRQLVLHSDNGAAMKAAGTLGVLAAYRVLASRSRPRVSNDNPLFRVFFPHFQSTRDEPPIPLAVFTPCRRLGTGLPTTSQTTTGNGITAGLTTSRRMTEISAKKQTSWPDVRK